jgi:hypothetical protein
MVRRTIEKELGSLNPSKRTDRQKKPMSPARQAHLKNMKRAHTIAKGIQKDSNVGKEKGKGMKYNTALKLAWKQIRNETNPQTREQIEHQKKLKHVHKLAKPKYEKSKAKTDAKREQTGNKDLKYEPYAKFLKETWAEHYPKVSGRPRRRSSGRRSINMNRLQ